MTARRIPDQDQITLPPDDFLYALDVAERLGISLDEFLVLSVQVSAPKLTRLHPPDILPAGCCLLDRDVIELIPFEHGTDVLYTDDTTGLEGVLGECGQFGNRLHELGEVVWMNPAVICDHENLS